MWSNLLVTIMYGIINKHAVLTKARLTKNIQGVTKKKKEKKVTQIRYNIFILSSFVLKCNLTVINKEPCTWDKLMS